MIYSHHTHTHTHTLQHKGSFNDVQAKLDAFHLEVQEGRGAIPIDLETPHQPMKAVQVCSPWSFCPSGWWGSYTKCKQLWNCILCLSCVLEGTLFYRRLQDPNSSFVGPFAGSCIPMQQKLLNLTMALCTSNCNLQMSGRPSTLALKVVNIVFLMPTIKPQLLQLPWQRWSWWGRACSQC